MNEIFEEKDDDNVFFSPQNILANYYTYLEKDPEGFLTRKDIKKIKEARIGAILAFALMRQQNKQYYLKIVPEAKEPPDIWLVTDSPKKLGKYNLLEYLDVELVTYTSHSNEDLADFILSKKLNPTKQYRPGTVIVCYIEKPTQIKSFEELNNKLNTVKQDIDIFILGENPLFVNHINLRHIYPNLEDPLIFDLLGEAKKWGSKENLTVYINKRPTNEHKENSKRQIKPF